MRKTVIRVAAACLVLAVLAVPAAMAQRPPQTRPEPGNKPIEIFNAFAVQMQAGRGAAVEIAITRWSTDEERQRLLDVLKEQGQPAMIADLQKMPQVGYIRTANSMGVGLFYARSNEMPDGSRQVVIGTDRAIGLSANAPTLSQYDATVIELHFPKGAKSGEGKIVLAGKASIGKDGKVQITNYSGYPVWLKDVKASTPKS
ncbi:MAG TPA: hypothetical protein VFA98_02015 [Thermoanaerobaculia bacterium]|nr:hypothetical protein [Thermoanaerobaculia bacterium]